MYNNIQSGYSQPEEPVRVPDQVSRVAYALNSPF